MATLPRMTAESGTPEVLHDFTIRGYTGPVSDRQDANGRVFLTWYDPTVPASYAWQASDPTQPVEVADSANGDIVARFVPPPALVKAARTASSEVLMAFYRIACDRWAMLDPDDDERGWV